MDNKEQQVFEVIDVEPRADGTWLVRGLSYQPIQVGNVLHIKTSNSIPESLCFQVTEIMTYHRSVTRLSPGYTGELVLEGPQGDNLYKASHLLI